jgi:hypothetical protein
VEDWAEIRRLHRAEGDADQGGCSGDGVFEEHCQGGVGRGRAATLCAGAGGVRLSMRSSRGSLSCCGWCRRCLLHPRRQRLPLPRRPRSRDRRLHPLGQPLSVKITWDSLNSAVHSRGRDRRSWCSCHRRSVALRRPAAVRCRRVRARLGVRRRVRRAGRSARSTSWAIVAEYENAPNEVRRARFCAERSVFPACDRVGPRRRRSAGCDRFSAVRAVRKTADEVRGGGGVGTALSPQRET